MERELKDAELVAECLAGNPRAWDALIHRYQGLIFSLALRSGLSSADADDLFQDTCVKLYRHLPELRDVRRLSGWLGAVVRQEIQRRWRSRTTASWSDLSERDLARVDLAGQPGPEDELLALEREHFVRLALREIGEDCLLLLELLYGPENIPYAEAAERLGMPLGSVGPRRARCLARLKKKLEELGF